MPRALSGNKPRRYQDCRTRAARRWAESYSHIASRYPPRDGLDRDHIAMATDFHRDYVDLRSAEKTGQKKNSSPIRKTAGIYLAIIRILGGGGPSNGHGEKDLARLIAEAQREGAPDEGE